MMVREILQMIPSRIRTSIDLCLPAVFMPFRSGNVFNPRAYRFFHHVGTCNLHIQKSFVFSQKNVSNRFYRSTSDTNTIDIQTSTIAFRLSECSGVSVFDDDVLRSKVSVLNLFELSRCYEVANEKDRAADKTTSQSSQPGQPPAPPTTQTSN